MHLKIQVGILCIMFKFQPLTLIIDGWLCSMSMDFETTNELDPLKGLTRLLTLVEMERKGRENH